ncbi:erythromycin esterase family protein [Capnocytophaga canis]|uniref:erythromycin esterase family protein n=1 Tax=Capnocytophaga canis TaxID=1848903 RepID=UPI00370DA508
MKRILSFITLVFFVTASAQVQTISKSDYEKADFTNLTTLQNDLKNVRIVGLGESSHYMGETYVSKIKMVKYMHQHCGFDVIAIESPLYDLRKYYNETVKTNQVKTPWHFTEISGVWITDDMYELFDYILETQKTDRPLIYTGFDEKLFYKFDYKLNDDYNEFLEKLNADTGSNIKTDSLFKKALNFTAEKCYYFAKVPPKDTLVLHNTFNEVKKALNKLETKNGYYYFWERMTENIKSLYRFNYKNLSHRDKQMAENVSYLANYEFPDKKIILWAASIHLMDNITKINQYDEKRFAKDYTMGHFLREKFKDQYYVIGFVPATGVTGFKGYLGLGKFKPKAKKGSFERYILDKYNPDYAFISLRSTLSRKEISENNIERSNFIGTTSYKMDMLSVVDAFFYLKEEHLVSFEKRKAYFKKEREDLERTADTSNK